MTGALRTIAANLRRRYRPAPTLTRPSWRAAPPISNR